MTPRFAVATLLLLVAASPAAAQTRTVTAVWDANTDNHTRGYVLAYGTAPGQYRWSHDAGAQTSAQITLEAGAVYYFSVRAYDASGTYGPGSAEAMIDLSGGPTAEISATWQAPGVALVRWTTSRAVSASINGVAVGPSGSASVNVSGTTTFRLVATAASGAMADAVSTVVAERAGLSARITATPDTPGTAMVTWTSTGSTRAWINGAAVAPTGTARLPAGAGVTSYRLLVEGDRGAMLDAHAYVGLEAAPLTARLTATPIDGGTAQLTWSTTGAVSASIDGVGVPVAGTTRRPYTPGVRYRLLATGPGGAMIDAFASVDGRIASGAGENLLPPSDFAIRLVGDTAVLSWQRPAGVAGTVPTAYQIEAGSAPGLADLAVFHVGDVSSFTSPVPAGRYYVRVRGISATAASAATHDVYVTPPRQH